ncbi:MAG: hypothetical protein IJQ11_10105 [Bacteroidales bacterium]|nr:hypothetical protein [Bacteroidales bacterium]
MKNNGILILDKVLEYIFGIVGAVALYGVIIKGAWWHILTVVACAVIAIASQADAKKEKAYGNKEI